MTEDLSEQTQRGMFHKRFNAARAAIYTADWEPDKAFKIQGNIVPYVSINKMKRNIAPALLKNGIDFKIEFGDLQIRRVEGSNGVSNYCSVECTITFFDDETGYSESSTAIGGCAASDKGLNICQTYALKQVLGNVFLLIDGIEPEDLEVAGGGTFRKRTEEETEEVKSNILSNKDVVMPETPKEKPKEEPKATVNPDIKNVDVDAERPKEKPKEATAPSSGKTVQLPKTVSGFEPSGPQRNSIANILETWEVAAKSGQTTAENYNKMSMDYASMSSNRDAVVFIRTYKVVF